MKAAVIILYILFSGLTIWTVIQQMQINGMKKKMPKPANGNGKYDTPAEEGDPNRIVYGEEVYDKVMNGAGSQRKIEITL